MLQCTQEQEWQEELLTQFIRQLGDAFQIIN